MELHEIEHLLTIAPDERDDLEMRQHKHAKVVIIGQLSREDKNTTYSYEYLHQAWSYLRLNIILVINQISKRYGNGGRGLRKATVLLRMITPKSLAFTNVHLLLRNLLRASMFTKNV